MSLPLARKRQFKVQLQLLTHFILCRDQEKINQNRTLT